jgi:hypothetical protein
MNVASVPTEQVSNRRTQNNKNRKNQTVVSVPSKVVSAEEFHYDKLTPNQVAALHQVRWVQHLD